MSGYFYAFADAAECGQVLPDVWDGDSLKPGVVERSTDGVWIVSPVTEEDFEAGTVTVISAGERSAPYVILTVDEYADAAAYRIEPDGERGFA